MKTAKVKYWWSPRLERGRIRSFIDIEVDGEVIRRTRIFGNEEYKHIIAKYQKIADDINFRKERPDELVEDEIEQIQLSKKDENIL